MAPYGAHAWRNTIGRMQRRVGAGCSIALTIVVTLAIAACSEEPAPPPFATSGAKDAGARPGDRSQGGRGEVTAADAATDAAIAPLFTGEPEQARNGDAARLALDITHSCVVRGKGTLWCWGTNTSGELDGRANDTTHARQVGKDSDWWAVAPGGWHTCAIKTDGSLWCWGDNRGGEVGSGSAGDVSPVVRIGEDPWHSVAGGQSHTCGVKTDGTLWCWGRNDSGQLGTPSLDGSTCPRAIGTISPDDPLACARVPQRVGSDDDWVAASAGGLFSCAWKSDGTLWCWGARDGLSPSQDEPALIGDEFAFGAVDGDMRCGVKRDGSAQCWYPSELTLADETWRTLTVGQKHACGMTRDEQAWCWGDGRGAVLGEGSPDARGLTAVGEPSAWAELVAGGWHSCGDTGDELRCWGSNAFVQLGDGLESHGMECVSADCSLAAVVVKLPE
jgi:alpha-tubulin suppressor-like RCC1 family protein